MMLAGLPGGWLAAFLCAIALDDRLAEPALAVALVLGALVTGLGARWFARGRPMPGLLSQAGLLALYLLPVVFMVATAAFMIYMFAYSFAGMMELMFTAFGGRTGGSCGRGECVSISVDAMPFVVTALCGVAQYLGLRLGARGPRLPSRRG